MFHPVDKVLAVAHNLHVDTVPDNCNLRVLGKKLSITNYPKICQSMTVILNQFPHGNKLITFDRNMHMMQNSSLYNKISKKNKSTLIIICTNVNKFEE